MKYTVYADKIAAICRQSKLFLFLDNAHHPPVLPTEKESKKTHKICWEQSWMNWHTPRNVEKSRNWYLLYSVVHYC